MRGERTAIEAGLHIIVPVWGESYTRLFTELSLPTLLAAGNIPALPHPDRHVFAIYTTTDDRRRIEASPAFARLVSSIKVEFYPLRTRIERITDPYDFQSDCYRRAIWRADAADQAMVFLTPDLVMADGSMRGLARIASTSVRAILGVGIRLDKESVRQHLLGTPRSPQGDTITISPRDLARLALDTLHPIAKAHMHHAESDFQVLSNRYWRVGSEGLLARCFHLHPFLVYPRVKNAPFAKSIDGDYIEAACPDFSETYIITDSDEFSAWELSEVGRRIPMMSRSAPTSAVIKWIREKTTPRHRVLIRSSVRIHASDADEVQWDPAESEANDIISKLLAFAELDKIQNPAAVARTPPDLRIVTALRDMHDARMFLEIALPSALAAGNIPRLPLRSTSHYTIALPQACATLIASSAAIAELRNMVKVDLRAVSDAEAAAPGFAATMRAETVRDAAAIDAVALFIEPDIVMANVNLSSAMRIFGSNIRAVVAPCIPIVAETGRLHLLRDYFVEGLLSIRSDELVYLAIQNLHPALASQAPGADTDPVDPGAMVWPVVNEGFIMHAFAFDPVLIYPRRVRESGGFSELLSGSGVDAKEVGVFNNSATFIQCRLSAREEPGTRIRRGELAAWAAARTTPFQQAIFRCRTRVSLSPERSANWKAVEAMADAGASQVLARIDPTASLA